MRIAARIPTLRPFILLLALLLAGCGGGPQTAGSTSATGVVYAPNGVDPVPGASVRVVPTSGPAIPPTLAVLCRMPAVAEATSGHDGAFRLPSLNPGDYTLIVSLGRFAKVSSLSIAGGVLTPIPPQQTTLPGLESATSSIPRMAVVTGFYDAMANVLAKFGLGAVDDNGVLVIGTERFDIYRSNDGYTVWNPEWEGWDYLNFPESYPRFETLFADLETMRRYDVIVVNCGLDIYAPDYFADPAIAARVRAYVEGGGRLYVTDQSYNFVEQAFPEYLRYQAAADFVGDPATPEPINSALVGIGGITTEASVRDAGLAAWLGGFGALNDNGSLHVGDFWGGWTVMVGPHATPAGGTVKTWVEGPVSFDSYDTADGYTSTLVEGAIRPLTVSFPCGLGSVIYTSYHTDSEPHPGFTPQERVLEYLLFQ
jgi:hypothetical protein